MNLLQYVDFEECDIQKLFIGENVRREDFDGDLEALLRVSSPS
jgi:hypothetical protein